MSLLARLIEAGTPADLIEEVAMMIAEKRAAERSMSEAREKARERQARKRERDQSRDVTQHNVTVCDTPEQGFSAPPNDIYSNPPHLSQTKNTKRARGGSRLPDDWQPKPLTGDTAAAVASWPVGAIERELARFRDWAASATGPNASKNDWQAAWRNWLRKAEDDGKYSSKNSQIGGRDNRDGVAKALDRRLGLDPFAEPIGRSSAGSGPGGGRGPVAYLAGLR